MTKPTTPTPWDHEGDYIFGPDGSASERHAIARLCEAAQPGDADLIQNAKALADILRAALIWFDKEQPVGERLQGPDWTLDAREYLRLPLDGAAYSEDEIC